MVDTFYAVDFVVATIDNARICAKCAFQYVLEIHATHTVDTHSHSSRSASQLIRPSSLLRPATLRSTDSIDDVANDVAFVVSYIVKMGIQIATTRAKRVSLVAVRPPIAPKVGTVCDGGPSENLTKQPSPITY